MTFLRALARRLTSFLTKSRQESELDAEIRAHLELLETENMRRGMNAREAGEAARREFGGVEQTKEAYREARGVPFLDALGQDLRFALRMLGKKPGFAAVDGCGSGIGLLGAWLSARLLESLLFQVRAHDPALLGVAVLVLLAVAFVAAWIPARRAMRVDPMVALRYE